jgi:PAS domain S-box-containing protein
MTDSDFKYELFFELSPDLLCIAGYDGYFKKVNSAVAKTLGYSLEELYSRPINDFVHPDDKSVTAKVRRELTRSKPLMNFENRYITKGGETVWLSWTSLPVESQELIFAIAKNITHRKRQEADRNALLANLTRKNKDLMDLNFATSDDLKSPVTSLLALFELIDLSRINDKETVELMGVLQYLGEKVKKALNTHVDELTRKRREEAVSELVDFQQCLDETLQSISTIVQTSKTSILADFSKLPDVRFSKNYLKSIYLNLITNAIKYASADRAPVINIHSDNSNGVKQLIVADNGSGFDAAKAKDEIFDFPQKYHSNPNSKGIGLYLVHSHVSALGGKVDIQSKLEVGTKVVITFR